MLGIKKIFRISISKNTLQKKVLSESMGLDARDGQTFGQAAQQTDQHIILIFVDSLTRIVEIFHIFVNFQCFFMSLKPDLTSSSIISNGKESKLNEKSIKVNQNVDNIILHYPFPRNNFTFFYISNTRKIKGSKKGQNHFCSQP